MGAVSHQSVVASTTEAAGSGAAGSGDRIEDICRQRQDGGYDMAYFAFRQYRGDEEFIFELTDEDKIAHARRIISGEETERVHVLGKIRKQKKPYNPMWDYHLDPDTISFFQVAIEVCNANMRYVEDHLDEACGAFLPGCFWCPWDSRVTREIKID